MRSLFFRLSALSAFFSGCLVVASAQSLDLGWNAVSVQGGLSERVPAELFSDEVVEMVAVWRPNKAMVSSLTSVDAVVEKPSEWHHWRPSDDPSAFLNDLFSMGGVEAFLVKTSEPMELDLQTDPAWRRQTWVAPSFNLVGFPIDPDAPPTFARYFDGSQAHEALRIFEMTGDEWTPVAPNATIQPDEAYWVWTESGSDFQGPLNLSVSLNAAGEAELFDPSAALNMSLRTDGSLPLPLTVTVSHPDLLHLGLAREEPASVSKASLTLERGQRVSLRLLSPVSAVASNGIPEVVLLTFQGGGVLRHLPVRLTP